eukprot:scaffold71687_cov36-Phaeocystis_antarctica.AAC.2
MSYAVSRPTVPNTIDTKGVNQLSTATASTPPRHRLDTASTPPRHRLDTASIPPRHRLDTASTPPTPPYTSDRSWCPGAAPL